MIIQGWNASRIFTGGGIGARVNADASTAVNAGLFSGYRQVQRPLSGTEQL